MLISLERGLKPIWIIDDDTYSEMEKTIEWIKANKIRSVTAFCFIMLMFINKVVANESQYIWLITNNLVGPAVVLVILSIYSVKDFKKPFYIIWTVLGILGTIGGYVFWYTHQVGHLIYACVTVPLNIWILGGALIKFSEEIVLRKTFRISIFKWEIPVIVCLLLMFFSRSETVWPIYYLLIFLLLWHTPFSYTDRIQVFYGMMDGILVGFILLQISAFINTPYSVPRYRGVFWNCNRNACLYLLALASVLGKAFICRLKMKETGCKISRQVYLYGCFSSMLVAMIIYTGSRTGLISVFLMAILYFWCERRSCNVNIRSLFVKSIIYGILAVMFVPLMYFPIRYLPELKPRARVIVKNLIKGTDDTYEPVQVLGFSEALSFNLLRYFEKNVSEAVVATEQGNADVQENFWLYGVDESGKYRTLNYEYIYYPERGIYITHVPSFIYSGLNAIDSRINIYAALTDQMNLWGHLDSEVMLDIRSDVPSAAECSSYNEQNVAIHYLYIYGVPIGIFVCILMLSELIWLIRGSIRGKSNSMVLLMFVSVYFIFGITEIVWVPGQIEQLMLFFAPLFLISCDGTDKKRLSISNEL